MMEDFKLSGHAKEDSGSQGQSWNQSTKKLLALKKKKFKKATQEPTPPPQLSQPVPSQDPPAIAQDPAKDLNPVFEYPEQDPEQDPEAPDYFNSSEIERDF